MQSTGFFKLLGQGLFSVPLSPLLPPMEAVWTLAQLGSWVEGLDAFAWTQFHFGIAGSSLWCC